MSLSSGVDRCRCALDRPTDCACDHCPVAAPCRKAPSHMTLFFMTLFLA